ncbi:uncharacterized protein LOC134139704 isoform X2 [Rhea pennata]|uniref:uncharacterized protein LOC134139704 isoform X2 n=1 Tax=Rhea pennata TaxID=8795 RepID=UPI002E26ED06
MLTVVAMSEAKLHVRGEVQKRLLYACFSSVFQLPPEEDVANLDASLYSRTMDVMDNMLQLLVLRHPTSGLQEMQHILQVLLPFIDSQQAATRKRAVVQVAGLTDFLVNCLSLLKNRAGFCSARSKDSSSASYGNLRLSIMGKLVGCLAFCCTYKDEGTSRGAADALHHLHKFLLQQRSREVTQDSCEHLELQEDREVANVFWVPQPIGAVEITMLFKKFLQPSEMSLSRPSRA